jgi:hypothetical protein
LPERPQGLQFERLLAFLKRPRQTLSEVAGMEMPAWLAPLLVISVLALLNVIIAGPIHQIVAQSGADIPVDFEYFTEEQQQQYLQAQTSAASPVFAYVFPALGRLAGIWVSWLVLGSLLHLALTLAGSRGRSISALNVAAWGSLPLAFRDLVQSGYMLFTHQLIGSQGLSGFVDPSVGIWAVIGSALLGLLDIFTLAQLALLLLAAKPLSALSLRKALIATLIAFIVFLILAAIPGIISTQFSGLSFTQPFFF